MRRITTTLICLTSLGGTLAAQERWTLTIERGFTSYSMAAHDTSTPQVRVLPWHPAVYTVRLAREGGRIGVAVSLGAAGGELAGTSEDVVVLPGAGLGLLEVAPEMRLRLTTLATGAELVAHAGPVLDLWLPEGDDARAAYGGIAGATLLAPITRRWKVSIRTDVTITGSEVTKAETSDALIRARTMRRGRLALGITRIL